MENQRRLATVVFAYRSGDAALGQMNESLSPALVEGQKRVIGPALVRHGGREVRTRGPASLGEPGGSLDAVGRDCVKGRVHTQLSSMEPRSLKSVAEP